MIRINLLKPLQPQQHVPLVLEEGGSGKKKALFVLAAVLVLGGAVLFLQYPSLFSGLIGGSEEEAVTAQPEPKAEPKAHEPAQGEPPQPAPVAPPQPKRVTAQAVEEIVREIQADQGREAPAQTYADLVPSEKIEFQYFACSKILKDIKAVTPTDVGFANFIFTPPGDFYIHGLAYGEQSYERFKQGLAALEGATVRPGRTSRAGARGTATEFSFYGTVKYPLHSGGNPPDRVVSKARLQTELRQLQNVAGSLGIRLKDPKLLASTPGGPAPGGGQYRKMMFQAAADCNYQQMQELLGQLYENKSNLGVVKFSLRARGDEQVVADLDILAYVN